MPDAVIVDAVRTPIGRAAKGSLKDVRADDLAAIPLAALVERNPEVDFSQTADILMGCGFPIGEQGYNVGRNAQLLAGIDHHVPAVTVSRFCSCSLQALRMAFHAIVAGEGDQYVAAGVEAVSRFPPHPPFDPHPRARRLRGLAVQRLHPDGGHGGERGQRCNVVARAQDEWAAISQQRAVAARDERPLRGRDRPGDARRRHAGHQGRRPAAGHDGGGALPAQARVRPRGHRHGRQRLPAQRRRGGGARDVRPSARRRSG